ncbi:MAG: PAS domain S-box protein, partial [Solirubrobacterales bacterium]
QDSEAKFRAIANYTGDVEIWIGPDGQPIWINPAIERFTGYTVEECMAMPDFPASLIHVEDRPRMLAMYQQACAGSSGNDVHYRLLRRDGSFLWASVSWQPIFGLDGEYLGWRSSHRDVTDRVQAEEALRRSESALQAAQRVAHVGSWSWHIPDNRIEWSDEMFRIFGIPKEQFSGDLASVVTTAIHPEDRDAVNRVNESVITEHKHIPLEFRIVWPDGSVRVAWAEAGDLTLDKHGHPLLLTGIVQDITERKQAQQALQISLQTSDDIVRAIPSGLFIYQFEPPDRLILINGNPEAERLTGIRLDQAKGREFNELWPKAREREEARKFLDVMRTGKPFVSADMQYPGDASMVFLRVRAFVLPQNRLAVAFDDVTEHRKAEQNLREREEVYSAIVNQAADSIVLIDTDTWRFVEFNDAACQGLGYTRNEFAQLSLREIQGVLSVPEVTQRMVEILETGKAAFENQQRCKDGTLRDVLVSNRLVRIHGHGYLVGVWRDITERKKVEEALRESRERFRSLYESVQAGVIVQRADGTISHCNRIACETFGVAEEDIRAQVARRSSWHMMMEDGTPVADADYPSMITWRTGKPIRGVVRGFYMKDPERLRWLLITTEPRFKADTQELDEVIVTFQDITEQKRAQQRAEQRQAELLHVSRLGTLGEMASGFAHELNQPLSAIMSYGSASLRSVQTDHFDTNRLMTNLGHIVTQASRAGEIIRRIRAFAQRRPLRLGPLDINAVVREAIDLLGSDVRHKATDLTQDLSADLPRVLGDSIQIQQVLLNLMRNAIEAMESVEPQRRRLILRTFAHAENAVAVSVSDMGPGMSEEMMARVFDAFFTTKENGLGIGLSISRSIIESHRGQFWVTSGPDGGCTFTFTLPAATTDSTNGPAPPGPG